jgi:hypothetical protein
MKTIISTIALVLAGSFGAYSQAFIEFANLNLNQPINDVNGVPLTSGSGYLADFFYAADSTGAVIPLSAMTDAGQATPIISSAMLGIGGVFNGGSVEIPVSGNIEFEVVVWQAAAGASWAAATGGGTGNAATYISNGGTYWFFSNQFQLTAYVVPSPAARLIGFQGGDVMVATPEPATLALGGLGVTALLFFRRRN